MQKRIYCRNKQLEAQKKLPTINVSNFFYNSKTPLYKLIIQDESFSNPKCRVIIFITENPLQIQIHQSFP